MSCGSRVRGNTKPLGVWCFSWPSSVQFSCCRVWLFATPWSAARQASLSITNSGSLFKLMSIESVMPSNNLILCCPLLLPPSIFPSIRVFSNESVLSNQVTKVFHSNWWSTHRIFWGSAWPRNQLSMKNCCHLVAISSSTTLKPVLKESCYSKGLWWFSSSVVSNSLGPHGL